MESRLSILSVVRYFALLLIISVAAAENVPQLFNHKGGVIPDKKTAVRIAEAVLFPIYGEKNIKEQRPYQVKLRDGKWIIDGTHPPHGFSGGSFHIVILQRDARVVEIGHGV